MIKSMTGFGRSEITEESYKAAAEIKSVNHRYLDITLHMPRSFNFLEGAVRSLSKQYVKRGKIDIFVACENMSGLEVSLRLREKLAREYMECFRQIEKTFGIQNDVGVLALSRCPEVIEARELPPDEEAAANLIFKALRVAFEKLLGVREREGEELKKDILQKLARMEELVSEAGERFPKLVSAYKRRLEERIKELSQDIVADEGRVAAEVVFFADKACTDEEIVRLKSHIGHMRATLLSGEEGIGRKLDFIAQEMNREANTILSKANDVRVSECGVELKTEVEKVREQLQNIE